MRIENSLHVNFLVSVGKHIKNFAIKSATQCYGLEDSKFASARWPPFFR